MPMPVPVSEELLYDIIASRPAPKPQPPRSNAALVASGAIGRANGGIVGLANGGMIPFQMPDLSNRETAYLVGMQALQNAMPRQVGYAMGGLNYNTVKGGFM
jgi:hypothetical protein